MTDSGYSRGVRRLAAIAVLVVAILVAVGVRPALAVTGSIKLKQHDPQDKAIAGGSAAIYQVGVISGSSYVYVEPFDSLGDDLTSHITDEVDLAYLARLESVALSSAKVLDEQEIGSDGMATFGGLEPGAYLIVQTEPAPGYNSFDRFLVTIPYKGQYDVDASPKLDPVTTTTNGNTNTTPTTPSNPSSSGSTPTTGSTPSHASVSISGKTLPQTGQLWWPVWVLLISGGSLVTAGLAWRRRHRVSGVGGGQG